MFDGMPGVQLGKTPTNGSVFAPSAKILVFPGRWLRIYLNQAILVFSTCRLAQFLDAPIVLCNHSMVEKLPACQLDYLEQVP